MAILRNIKVKLIYFIKVRILRYGFIHRAGNSK